MSKLFLLSAFIFLSSFFAINLSAQTETIISGDLVLLRFANGLNVSMLPMPSSGRIDLNLYVKTGSLYENDSVHGMANLLQEIIAEKIASYLRSGRNPISFQNTGFTSNTTSEYSVYKFTCQYASVSACLRLFSDSVFSCKISKPELTAAINSVTRDIENARHNKRKVFDDKMIKRLYTEDHLRMEAYGSPKDNREINTVSVTGFHNRYYVPNNALLAASGNFGTGALQQELERALGGLIKSAFDVASVAKIVDIKPMIYTTQFVVEDTTNSPEFEICWQFPGTANGQQASYSAYIVNAMLNDKNNFIQVKAAKLGCKKFVVQYDPNNFSGIFKIIIQPSKQHFFETYQFVVREMGRLDNTLLNDETVKVAKLDFKQEFKVLQKSNGYPDFVVRHWPYSDESYFTSLADSVMAVSNKKLQSFISEYLNGSAHASGLLINKKDRESLKVDSLFSDLDEDVAKYVFKYRQNITDLEGQDNNEKLNNLLQWLSINSDISAQINGYSDEHEYEKVKDDTIIQFIDSMPSFENIKTGIIHKRFLRPEMMRAMKIVKYLYDHGISADRLSGTSMQFTSATKQEAIDNQKCTLTLNKYHKSPSLFDYHYGKIANQGK